MSNVGDSTARIVGHPALQYLLANEPEVVLPLVAFEGLEPLLAWSADFARHELAGRLDPVLAGELGAWVARVIVSYGLEPHPSFDLADTEVARWFVRTFLMPGLQAAMATADAPAGPVPGSFSASASTTQPSRAPTLTGRLGVDVQEHQP